MTEVWIDGARDRGVAWWGQHYSVSGLYVFVKIQNSASCKLYVNYTLTNPTFENRTMCPLDFVCPILINN